MSPDRPSRPPEPLLAPAVEARIREIVRAMIPEIIAAMDESLAFSLRNVALPGSGTEVDEHQVVTRSTPKGLGD